MSENQTQINPSKQHERHSGYVLAAGAAVGVLALGPVLGERVGDALQASTDGLTGESHNIRVEFEQTDPGQPIEVRTEDN